MMIRFHHKTINMITQQIYLFILCFGILMFIMNPPQTSFRKRMPKFKDFYKRNLF